MTLAEFEDFCEATKHMTAVQRAKAYGSDISLIDETLRLTPTKKAEPTQIANRYSF